MFVKYSNEKILNQKLLLDSIFVSDYMPFAPEMCVKVYLYGLTLAASGADNSPQFIAKSLGIKEDDVLSAYKYWEDQGLVSMLSISPPLVEYKEIVSASKRIRTFSKAKYKAFNDSLHAMFPNRVMLQNEYSEYYNLVESLHIETEAMLAIIAYCVRLKGENIGYPYILTVARNLAAEGYTTFDRINERLSEFDLYDEEIKSVIKALKQRRQPDLADKRYYIKWTKAFGFTSDTIIKVAKDVLKGGVERLDFLLTRYYENHVYSYEEITAFNLKRDNLFGLTSSIVKVLGRYYERLDYIIETYTQKWLNYGFSDEALLSIAEHCFKQSESGKSGRDLDTMDAIVTDFYEKGLLNQEAIDKHKEENAGHDEIIKKILNAANIIRNVSSWDRDYYRTWTYSWGMPLDLIEYSATLSKGKGMAYINGILASFRSNNVKTLEEAKKRQLTTESVPNVATVTKKNAVDLQNEFNFVDGDNI